MKKSYKHFLLVLQFLVCIPHDVGIIHHVPQHDCFHQIHPNFFFHNLNVRMSCIAINQFLNHILNSVLVIQQQSFKQSLSLDYQYGYKCLILTPTLTEQPNYMMTRLVVWNQLSQQCQAMCDLKLYYISNTLVKLLYHSHQHQNLFHQAYQLPTLLFAKLSHLNLFPKLIKNNKTTYFRNLSYIQCYRMLSNLRMQLRVIALLTTACSIETS